MIRKLNVERLESLPALKSSMARKLSRPYVSNNHSQLNSIRGPTSDSYLRPNHDYSKLTFSRPSKSIDVSDQINDPSPKQLNTMGLPNIQQRSFEQKEIFNKPFRMKRR